jgi:hypothetical protein
VAGKTEKEAADNFLGYLQETVSCVTTESLTAFQQSKKLYKVFFNPPAELTTRAVEIILARYPVPMVPMGAYVRQIRGRTLSAVKSAGQDPKAKPVWYRCPAAEVGISWRFFTARKWIQRLARCFWQLPAKVWSR